MAIEVTSINGMGSITESGGTFTTSGMEASDHMHISEDFLDLGGVIANSLNNNPFHVTANNNMTVSISEGVAYILNAEYTASNINEQRYWRVKSDSSAVKTINYNTDDYGRYDLIYLKVDPNIEPDSTASNVATIEVLEGEPASSPVVPDTPANAIPLAKVLVGSGVSSITSANITDARYFVGLHSIGEIILESDNAHYSEECYLKCDGSAVNRADYPALFAKIGTTYGAGDGSTTFNLPNNADLPMIREKIYTSANGQNGDLTLDVTSANYDILEFHYYGTTVAQAKFDQIAYASVNPGTFTISAFCPAGSTGGSSVNWGLDAVAYSLNGKYVNALAGIYTVFPVTSSTTAITIQGQKTGNNAGPIYVTSVYGLKKADYYIRYAS